MILGKLPQIQSTLVDHMAGKQSYGRVFSPRIARFHRKKVLISLLNLDEEHKPKKRYADN